MAYRDQKAREADPSTANFRYLIRTGDHSRLIRDHVHTTYGIDVNIKAENNVHNWLDPQSKHFRQSIYNTIFHYAARTSKDERFKLCIATPDMRDAAWTCCHKQQLILDGTFGISKYRLLLWIAMGLDESGSGLPVALFLFSAPTGARATHAGYNTAILTELLESWRNWLGTRNGEAFEPYAAMTDTDLKERAALAKIWEHIILLLCRFHLRQCWTNKRKALRISPGLSHYRTALYSRLFNLEES